MPSAPKSDQIEASLLTLATNARDATAEGGRLQIATANKHLDEDHASLHPGLVPGDYALVEVTDNDTGMTKQTMAQIFEPCSPQKGRDMARGSD